MVRVNQENLIPFNKRTESEKRRIATMGGIASGVARKEKATMKKTLEKLLDTVPDIESNPNKKTFRELSTEGLLIGAVQGKAENYKLMLQVIGELEQESDNETPSININIVDNSNLEKTLYEEKDL